MGDRALQRSTNAVPGRADCVRQELSDTGQYLREAADKNQRQGARFSVAPECQRNVPPLAGETGQIDDHGDWRILPQLAQRGGSQYFESRVVAGGAKRHRGELVDADLFRTLPSGGVRNQL